MLDGKGRVSEIREGTHRPVTRESSPRIDACPQLRGRAMRSGQDAFSGTDSTKAHYKACA
jgi:hypothetical protein